MSESISVLLVPGLACSPRLYAPQMPALWQAAGAVMVANHTGADTMSGIVQAIVASAPPRFHLVGLSMGGYISFEILRQASARVVKLALIDTGARADTAEQTERRKKLIALAEQGKLAEINDTFWPLLVHETRQSDKDFARDGRHDNVRDGRSGVRSPAAGINWPAGLAPAVGVRSRVNNRYCRRQR